MAPFNKLKNVLMLAFDWILYGAGKTFFKLLVFSHVIAAKQD